MYVFKAFGCRKELVCQTLLLKNDEKEAVEYFITAVEVNDPEEIMAQVKYMRMCMDLPHVNLLHAEAWL